MALVYVAVYSWGQTNLSCKDSSKGELSQKRKDQSITNQTGVKTLHSESHRQTISSCCILNVVKHLWMFYTSWDESVNSWPFRNVTKKLEQHDTVFADHVIFLHLAPFFLSADNLGQFKASVSVPLQYPFTAILSSEYCTVIISLDFTGKETNIYIVY